jgi:hypothetical protein
MVLDLVTTFLVRSIGLKPVNDGFALVKSSSRIRNLAAKYHSQATLTKSAFFLNSRHGYHLVNCGKVSTRG